MNSLTKIKPQTPKLRFPEFSGDWVARKVSEFATVKTGSRDTKNRVDGGQYPFFVRSDNVENIDTYAFDGEAVLTSGDGVGVGKNIHYINGRFDYHQRVYAIYDFDNGVTGKFFFQFFKENFLRRVMRLSAKNSVDSVRMSMITDMEVKHPSLPEQEKIAAFLGAVDDKISQLSRKKDLLEQYKTGCMQKLFSQKIRFTQDDGTDFPDWEVYPFRSIVKKIGDKFDPIKSGDTPTLIELENITSRTGRVVGHSSLEGQKSLKTVFKSGDVLFGKLRPYLRKYARPNFAGVCSTEIWVLRGTKVSNEYLFQIVQSDYFMQLATMSSGSKMPRSDWKIISQSDFEIPKPEEQKKIADFLSAIDKKIDLVTSELDHAKAFKKGLLQQMFV